MNVFASASKADLDIHLIEKFKGTVKVLTSSMFQNYFKLWSSWERVALYEKSFYDFVELDY